MYLRAFFKGKTLSFSHMPGSWDIFPGIRSLLPCPLLPGSWDLAPASWFLVPGIRFPFPYPYSLVPWSILPIPSFRRPGLRPESISILPIPLSPSPPLFRNIS